jgi:hypothetical protein
VILDEKFDTMSVSDDGRGMTPASFVSDFTRIGGSYTRLSGEKTEGGRPKIGSKGIGFLSPARYCSSMKIETVSTGLYQHEVVIDFADEIDLAAILNWPVEVNALIAAISVESLVVVCRRTRKDLTPEQYQVDANGVLTLKRPSIFKNPTVIELSISVDMSRFVTNATIDFDYLLSLENKRDLGEIEDFCELRVSSLPALEVGARSHTNVSLCNLKPFVREELAEKRKRGHVRNIGSRSGVEQFVWKLGRNSPAEYDLPPAFDQAYGEQFLREEAVKNVTSLLFIYGEAEPLEIKRPLWESSYCGEPKVLEDTSVAVEIERDGLKATGFIYGHDAVVFPAEYRGVSIRVRNVQIGEPTFFGLENILTGPERAALSQITGEINVVEGLGAINAINPGRESFYEENEHYKILKRAIVGDKNELGGLLSEIVRGILARNRVSSWMSDILGRGDMHRKALDTLSNSVLHVATEFDHGPGLVEFVMQGKVEANGLSKRENIAPYIVTQVNEYLVEVCDDASEEFSVDHETKKVFLKSDDRRWSNRITLLGKAYEVVYKVGIRGDALCEVDTEDRIIYVNWEHRLRFQMDDLTYTRSAIAWTIAQKASAGQGDIMMELGLGLLSYEE